jgi:hypothetical protein
MLGTLPIVTLVLSKSIFLGDPAYSYRQDNLLDFFQLTMSGPTSRVLFLNTTVIGIKFLRTCKQTVK